MRIKITNKIFCAMVYMTCVVAALDKFSEESYFFNALSPHDKWQAPHGSQQEKTCSTFGIGLDILEQISQKVVEQYIEKFNDNQYKNIQDYDVHPLIGNYTVRLNRQEHTFGAQPLGE